MMNQKQLERLLQEADKLHQRNVLAGQVGPDWFEPGMMEYLDQSDGAYDPITGSLILRFEAKGTRYDGRTEQIEKVHVGDEIRVLRDAENPFNPNNFTMTTIKGKNVGHMPAELCNAIAPLYDEGALSFVSARASFVDPISKRNRHAKQGMLFVELCCRLSLEDNFYHGVEVSETNSVDRDPIVLKTNKVDLLLEYLHSKNVVLIDKRSKNGALWVVGDHKLDNLMATCAEMGFNFIFTNKGGKATKGAPGWYFRDRQLEDG